MLGSLQRTFCMQQVACGSSNIAPHVARSLDSPLTRCRPASAALHNSRYVQFKGARPGSWQQWQPRRSQTVCSSAAADLPLPNPDGGALFTPSCRCRKAHRPLNHQMSAGSIPFSPLPEGSAFLAKTKGLLFYLFTLALSVPLFISMLVMTPLVLLLDKHRYEQKGCLVLCLLGLLLRFAPAACDH